ncbi:hypothetical protein DV515_00017863 [Chloebia gouldiae]|uniref:Uncharacterized protein n=1 Tax=Chloebia gouldiae TaxID=44316 RepID=A0A3L8Q9B8_CHLGU|nr:hypothetical protein DV515_00017863 [Chloebia gouldiae]
MLSNRTQRCLKIRDSSGMMFGDFQGVSWRCRSDGKLTAPEQCQGRREGAQTQKIPTAHGVNDPSRERQRSRGTGAPSRRGLRGSCGESSARVRRGECSA